MTYNVFGGTLNPTLLLLELQTYNCLSHLYAERPPPLPVYNNDRASVPVDRSRSRAVHGDGDGLEMMPVDANHNNIRIFDDGGYLLNNEGLYVKTQRQLVRILRSITTSQ